MATNLEYIKSASGTDITQFNITDIFSSKYDVYHINIYEYINSDNSDFFTMRFLDSGGSLISDNEYAYANFNMRFYTSSSQNKSDSTTEINNIGYSQSNSISSTANTISIYNPFDSSSFTFVDWQGAINVHGFGGAGAKAIACHKNAEQITGVNFRAGASASPNSINSIKAYVYGYR